MRCGFKIVILVGILVITTVAQDEIALNGTVKDAKGTVIAGALVRLVKDTTVKDVTDEKGDFFLSSQVSIQKSAPFAISVQNGLTFGIKGNQVQFTIASASENGAISIFASNGRRNICIPLGKMAAGTHRQVLPELAPGFYLMLVTIDQLTTSKKLVITGNQLYLSDDFGMNGKATGGIRSGDAGTTPPTIDTLLVTKAGFKDTKKAIDSYKATGIAIVMEEAGSTPEVVECPDVKLPSASALAYNNSKHPDPFEFKFMDLPRVTTKALWECRKKEISLMAQEYLYGHLPPKCEVKGTVSGGTITADCSYNGKSAKVSVSATGSGDVLVIDFGMGVPKPATCRSASMNTSSLLSTAKSLFGSSDMGICMAGAWGVGRIIDALEQNPDCGISAKKVVTTGCSTCGKQAAIAGIFEPRVAVCAPVESGCGGTCSWRVSRAYGNGNSNTDCQDITHLETNWLGDVAGPFRNGSVKVDKLPLDQHEVMALRAPGAMMAFNNYKEWKWLCARGNVAAAQGCHWVYKALGVSDHFGFAESAADHGHCSFPNEHKSEIQAFYDKFLDGKDAANTNIMRWNSASEETSKWFDYDTNVVLE